MPWTFEHIEWLVDTGERYKTNDGKDVEVWDFRHENDPEILSAWAKHFRNHYCLDTDIDILRGGKKRSEYLKKIKFPDPKSKLGPGIRAGDFGEILVADYLQWRLDFWVPRIRWGSKIVSDESPKGCDVIGFKFNKKNGMSKKDILAIYETKTKFSKSSKNRIQHSINDSAKDHIRIDESLNYIKQKLYEQKELAQVKMVDRFQSPIDFPYKESYGAATIFTEDYFTVDEIVTANTKQIPKTAKSKEYVSHPNRDSLVIIVIKGVDMMNLVHELYRRAADEA